MAVNIATLAIKFVADTSGIKQGVGSVVSSVLTGAAAFIGINKAINAFSSGAERIDKMSKVADRLGVSFNTIQNAALTGKLAGVELESLTDAIDKMSKNIGSGGMSLDKRFLEQADAIAAIVDPAEQARKAMEVFGKSGAKLLPLLKQGKNAFREAADFIKRFDLGIDDIDAKNVERMNDSWTKLGAVISGTVDKIVAEMAPAMGAFLDRTLDRMGSMERVWKGFGIVTEDILTDFADFGELFDSFGHNIENTTHALKAVGQEILFIGNLLRRTPFQIMEWDPPNPVIEKDIDMRAAAADREWGKAKDAEEKSTKSWNNFWKGTAGKELSAEAAKRRAEADKKLGSFGGIETKFANGADRGSQAAAKNINAAVFGAMSPNEKAAADTAKNTAATKAAVDKLVGLFAGNVPVLALGGL